MSTDLLSTKQVAERRGVTASAVSRWVAAGKLTPALKLEGRTGAMWFRPGDVDALVADLPETDVAS